MHSRLNPAKETLSNTAKKSKQACGDAAVWMRTLHQQAKQMVLLEQKIKIIQWREKLDMQMRAGSEFTNMCRVKSENP